ncbi:hypothetical protein [Cesiribacter andamanensis]|uniref:hypothetical protein n=1 Tax=Cesiribacter andamanensis TaxID=649507 RepID=UPI0003453563|nr:hypothetical protein [Cesiribacter andamanensis]
MKSSLIPLWAALLCSLLPLTATAQKLLLKESFAIPTAVAATQDVQGALYLATQQGQVHQLDGSGKKLGQFSPDDMLYINSLQALPGLHLLLFDRTNQQLLWLDRFMTLKRSYSLAGDNRSGLSSPGLIDAVAPAEGNALWLVDGSQQRLLKQQLPEGEVLLSVPLNLVSTAQKLAISYMREHKGKLYLYSSGSGMLVFDIQGNYEQTLKMPEARDLWLEGGRFYFTRPGYLGFLDLDTKEVIQIPVLDKDVRQLLVKGSTIWLLGQGQAVKYLLMP